jgi:hypothetical protein
MAESYFQHAEHYFRILNAMNQAAQQGQPQGGQQGGQNQGGQNQQRRQHYQDGGESGGEGSEGEEAEVIRPAGLGEQPNGEAREIDIAAVPPER